MKAAGPPGLGGGSAYAHLQKKKKIVLSSQKVGTLRLAGARVSVAVRASWADTGTTSAAIATSSPDFRMAEAMQSERVSDVVGE